MIGFRSLDNSTYERVLDLLAVCYLRLSKENYSNRVLHTRVNDGCGSGRDRFEIQVRVTPQR